MKLRLTAVTLAALLAVSACGGDSDDDANGAAGANGSAGATEETSATEETQAPQTLEAATEAAQQLSDSFSSGDYGAAWDQMSTAAQDGVSRDDYIAFGEACRGADGTGVPISVEGVRLDSEESAVVTLETEGVSSERTMSYEDGQWRQEPSTQVEAGFGKSVEDWVAAERAAGRCSD